MADIEELRKLEAAATAGPWVIGQSDDDCGPEIYWLSPCDDDSNEATIATFDTGEHDNAANATLLLELRNSAPSLIAEIESLRKRCAAAESALKDIASWQHDTLGTRDGKSSPDTETFDRGTRMAFYRCAERARSALSTEGR